MTGPPHSVVGRFQARRFSLIAAQAIRRTQARYFFGEVLQADGTYALREQSEAYGHEFASESDALRLENTISWNENAETVET